MSIQLVGLFDTTSKKNSHRIHYGGTESLEEVGDTKEKRLSFGFFPFSTRNEAPRAIHVCGDTLPACSLRYQGAGGWDGRGSSLILSQLSFISLNLYGAEDWE